VTLVFRMLRLSLLPTAVLGVLSWMSSSSEVAAACKEWDLSRVPSWSVKQSNNYILNFTFQQRGSKLQGSGSYYFMPYHDPKGGGTLWGSISGASFEFTTSWGGIYTGWVNDNGTLNGNTRDSRNRNSRATWWAIWNKASCVR
jgi:hypothetical protein